MLGGWGEELCSGENLLRLSKGRDRRSESCAYQLLRKRLTYNCRRKGKDRIILMGEKDRIMDLFTQRC